jgi:hypothetical protein
MLTGRDSWLLLAVELRLAWRELFRNAAAARIGMLVLALTIALAHLVAGLLVGLLPDTPGRSAPDGGGLPQPGTGHAGRSRLRGLVLYHVRARGLLWKRHYRPDAGLAGRLQAVFSSKSLANAARATAPFAVIILPLANMAIWHGHRGSGDCIPYCSRSA